jgi:Brf1-like TBP-binding domain/Transcription factor TFIIB repeat
MKQACTIVTNNDSMPFAYTTTTICRYSGRLNLREEDKNRVNILATKVTAQMNRDWIHTGRRPAGICAVALQIACNTYNITTVTRKDICRVLRICDATVTKRIREFEQTPAALMSRDDFLKQLPPKFDRVEGDQIERVEFDPPSFITNRIKDGTVDALLAKAAATKHDVKSTAASDNSDDDHADDSDNSNSSNVAVPVVGKGKGNARKRKLAAAAAKAAKAKAATDSDDMSVDNNATDDDDDNDSDTSQQQQQQQQSATKGSKKRKRPTTATATTAKSSKGKSKAKASTAVTTSDQLSDLSDDDDNENDEQQQQQQQQTTKTSTSTKAASKLRSSTRRSSNSKSDTTGDADECSNDDDADYVDNNIDSSNNDNSDSDDSLSTTSNKKQKKATTTAKTKAGSKKESKEKRTKKAKKVKKQLPVYEDIDPSDAAATIQHAMLMRAQHARYKQQGPKMIKRQDDLQVVIDTTIEDMKNDLMMYEEQPVPEAREEFILPPIEVEVKHDADNADNGDTNATADDTADSDKTAVKSKKQQQQKQTEASDEVIEGELPDNNDDADDNDNDDDDFKHTTGSGGGSSSSTAAAASKRKASKVTFAEINHLTDTKIIATSDGVPIVYVDMVAAEAYDEAAAVARLTAELQLPADDTYSDIDDDDFMREHIIPKADSARKAIVWQEINKVYLAAQEEKSKFEKQEIANNGGTKPVKRSYKKQKIAASAAHAIEKLANEKKISNKINYEAIKSAFDPDGNSYSNGAASSRSRRNNDTDYSNTGDTNSSTENPYQNYTEIFEDVDDDDYKAQLHRTQLRTKYSKGDESISIRSTHPAPLSTSNSKSNDDAADSSSKAGSSKGKGKAKSSTSNANTATTVKKAVEEQNNNDDEIDDEEEEEEEILEHYSEDEYDGEEY